MKAGVADFIEKPFDDEVLLSAVRANATAPAFDAILTLSAKPSLSDADWRHLAAGLGVAA